MLTAHELASMRATVGGSLPDLATIQTVTRTADGQGGFTESWATAYSSVPCRLHAPKVAARTGETAGQYQVETSWPITLRYDQPIAAGQRIVTGGNTYEVVSVTDTHSERVLRQAQSRRLD